MEFPEVREALHKGYKIRHGSMPEGQAIMLYRRGWGTDLPILVDERENLSGAHMDFASLFWAAIAEYDDEWEVLS